MILAWIELIVMFFKAVILSGIYSSIILLLLFLIYRVFGFSFLERVVPFGIPLFVLFGFIIFISLFNYRFSYWEDTGMGETLQVPIGYKQYVYNADGAMTYFDLEPDKEEYLQQDHLLIEKYYMSNKTLCAELSHEFSDHPDFKYMIYNIETKVVNQFANAAEYDTYAVKNQLPRSRCFYDFADHYNNYLLKKPEWKKWLLL